jgi:hypothetical protein
VLALALASLFARHAHADDRDETERWVPSIGVISGVVGQNSDASTDSGDVTYVKTSRVRNTSFPPNVLITQQTLTNPLRPSTDGDDLLMTPFVGGSLELMTPGWRSLPAKPRLFVHGDLAAAFGVERHIARESAPEGDLPDPLLAEPNTSEAAVPGVGSETNAEVQPFLVGAGAGVAFSFDLFGRRVRVKPSVEYLREEIEVSGVLNRAILIDTGIQFFPATPGPPARPQIDQLPATFIPVSLKDSTTEAFHGLGPGLAVEMDALRTGPIMLALFAGVNAYHILNDRKVELSAQKTLTNPALTPNPQSVEAEWRFEKDPWFYRGTVGLRFRWLPE